MIDNAKDFFKKIVLLPSPSGFEEPVQRAVREYADPFADEIKTDVHGNVIVVRNPESPIRIMLAGHCDQIGFIINYIDNDGFLYVQSLGGWDPQMVIGARACIWTEAGMVRGVFGKKPIHLLNEEEKKKTPKIQDLWIDIGANSKEDAIAKVGIGSPVTVELKYDDLLNETCAATATDDKTGVWVVMEALRRIDPAKLHCGVYAVSTVQEEVGLRGSKTSSFGIDPMAGIAVDVTFATDCPTVEKKITGDIKVGEGPVIGVGPNMNRRLSRQLFDLASQYEIPVQIEAEGRITGTDAASLQVNRAGMAAGLLSIPNRYMHSPAEIISWKDLDAAANLLARYCESVGPETSYIPQ